MGVKSETVDRERLSERLDNLSGRFASLTDCL